MSKVIKSQFTNSQISAGKLIEPITFAFNGDKSQLDPNAAYVSVEKQRILAEYEEEARKVLLRAQEDAMSIRQEIEKEMESWNNTKSLMEEEARKQGFELGLAEGRQQGLSEYTDKLSEAQRIIEETKKESLKQVERAEKTILNLGLRTAEKILAKEIETSPESMISIVKEVLKEAGKNSEVNIYVHPSQYSLLASSKEELDSLMLRDSICYLIPDNHLNPQQCIIESNSERIDASIDTQLNEMKRQLYMLLEEDAEDES